LRIEVRSAIAKTLFALKNLELAMILPNTSRNYSGQDEFSLQASISPPSEPLACALSLSNNISQIFPLETERYRLFLIVFRPFKKQTEAIRDLLKFARTNHKNIVHPTV
jgi:hypothetical protein